MGSNAVALEWLRCVGFLSRFSFSWSLSFCRIWTVMFAQLGQAPAAFGERGFRVI